MWIWNGIINPFGWIYTDTFASHFITFTSFINGLSFTQTRAHMNNHFWCVAIAGASAKYKYKKKHFQIYSCYRAIITKQTNKISIRLASLVLYVSQFLHNLSFSSHLNFSFFVWLSYEHTTAKTFLITSVFAKWKRIRALFFWLVDVCVCSFARTHSHFILLLSTRIEWVKMLFVEIKKKAAQVARWKSPIQPKHRHQLIKLNVYVLSLWSSIR